MDITPDEIPSGESFDFMLVPPLEETNGGVEEDTNENKPEQKEWLSIASTSVVQWAQSFAYPKYNVRDKVCLNLFD